MSLPSRLMGSGVGAQAAVNICGDTATAVTAAGTTAGTATQLSATNNNVSTTAAGTGVILMPTESGGVVLLRNTGASTLKVYPASGSTINGAASIDVFTGAGVLLFATSGTEWFSLAAPGTVAPTEIVTATNVITAAESGTTFFLNSATEFVSTLPAPAQGLNFSFIVTAAPSGASYTVVTNASANIIKGQAYVCADAAGDAGTADDTITFVDGQSVAGDRVDVISDGTSWFARAFVAVAAGITFTQAS